MRDREGGNAPPRSGQQQARLDGAQSIAGLALGPDRVGEITTREGNGLAAADDLDRSADLVELERGEEPRQPRHMIQVQVGQQHVAQPAESELGAHQLALGPLAAIDEEPSRPAGDQQRRGTPLGGGYRRRGAEKDEFEHQACRKNSVGEEILGKCVRPLRAYGDEARAPAGGIGMYSVVYWTGVTVLV